MKQILHKIASIFLAVIVLFSTFSFTVDSHYCGDYLVDVAVFSKAEGCGMEMLKTDTNTSEITKKSCCKNETNFVEGNSSEQQAIQKVALQQVYFATAFVVSYTDLFTHTSSEKPYYQYKPPLIDKDITVLFENFRI